MEEQSHHIEGYAHIVQLLIKCKHWCEQTVIGGNRQLSQPLIDEAILYDVTTWLSRAIDALHCITDAQQKETADELVRLLEMSDSDPAMNQIASSTSTANTHWEPSMPSFDGLRYGESSSNHSQSKEKPHPLPLRNELSSAVMDFGLLDDNALTILDTRYGSEESRTTLAHDIGGLSTSETMRHLSNPLALESADSEQSIRTSRRNSTARSESASDLDNQQKRRRRRWADVARPYYCTWQNCEKSYGTMSHLNTHIRAQDHGKPKHLTDYPEVTEASSPRSMLASTPTSTFRSRAARVEAAAAAAANLQRSASPSKKRRCPQPEILEEDSRSLGVSATALGKRPMLRPRNSDETDEEDSEVALSKGSLDLLLRAIKVVKVLKQSGELD